MGWKKSHKEKEPVVAFSETEERGLPGVIGQPGVQEDHEARMCQCRRPFREKAARRKTEFILRFSLESGPYEICISWFCNSQPHLKMPEKKKSLPLEF